MLMWLFRLFLRLSAITLILIFLSGIGLISYVFYEYYLGDYSEFTREKIQRRISAETSVYYRDGKTKMGVFFVKEHRTYIPISEMPSHLLNALIGAEDYYFYSHPGINPFSLVRAAVACIKAGRIVQGGSTLTQQAAKNLFHRRNRSFKAKFVEMIQSLKLEKVFSKKDILEFYLNQFHVVGTGRGIGIAAKYYFDKEVRDLTLIESAFIAGSVKGPFKYDPRTKKIEKEKTLARENAKERKDWVLKRMLQNHTILQEEFNEAHVKPIPFKFGNFRYKAVSMLDFVRRQLNNPEILKQLGYENVAELTTSGLRIITTMDNDFQVAAQYHVRRNLSRVEHLMSGFSTADPAKYVDFKDINALRLREFYFAKVVDIQRDLKNPKIIVSYGVAQGEISAKSLFQMAYDARWFAPKNNKNDKMKPQTAYLAYLLDQIAVGDVIFTAVDRVDKENSKVYASLEVDPTVEGAFIIIDKGNILTLISGFESNTYNRAMYALRQPGSVFKPLVYYAALQMGWNLLDPLKNERSIYSFGQDFYYPKPDHHIRSNEVSMVWAGAQSENLASIDLTVKLTDKLHIDEFKELAKFLDLAPRLGEEDKAFKLRIRDKHGIVVIPEQIKRFIFPSVIGEILPDLIFQGDKDLVQSVRKLEYGLGFEKEIEEYTNRLDPEYVNEKIESGEITDPLSKGEIVFRLVSLKNNFINYQQKVLEVQKRMQILFDYYNQLHAAAEEAYSGQTNGLNGNSNHNITVQIKDDDETLLPHLQNFYIHYVEDEQGKKGRIVYMDAPPSGEEEFPPSYVALQPKHLIQLILTDETATSEKDKVFISDNVWIDNRIPVMVVNKIGVLLEEKFQSIWAGQENHYTLEMLSYHRDFRTLLGLQYLIKLGQLAGVHNKLSPILSFPLGTNDVTLAECAKIYQTLLAGKVYKYYNGDMPNQLNIIKQIEDRFGNVLYKPRRQEGAVVDPLFSKKIMEILGKTMTQGTGRARARRIALPLKELFDNPSFRSLKIRIPTYGKTGTTNDYTNSTFVGFLPYPLGKQQPIDPSNAYVMAAYVGYDNNRKMVRKPIKITGAHGALPVWADVAKSIIKMNKYVESLDVYDLTIQRKGVYPVFRSDNVTGIRVNQTSGLFNSVIGSNGSFDSVSRWIEYQFSKEDKNVVYVEGHLLEDVFKQKRYFRLFSEPYRF